MRTYKADGDIHADRLIEDLKMLETKCDLKMLPDNAIIADIDQRLDD